MEDQQEILHPIAKSDSVEQPSAQGSGETDVLPADDPTGKRAFSGASPGREDKSDAKEAGSEEPSSAEPRFAEPGFAVPPAADTGGRILESVAALGERLDTLAEQFDERIRRNAYEEKIVDQMHDELQRYKNDLYAQLVRPILTDIIEARDSILRVAASFAARAEGERDVPLKTFAGYAFDLQDILEKNGVEVFQSRAGDGFTPIRQRAVRKVKTDDASLHGKVAESLSSGYVYNGRVLSAEKIAVYYYEAPAVHPAENEEEK